MQSNLEHTANDRNAWSCLVQAERAMSPSKLPVTGTAALCQGVCVQMHVTD